MASGDITWFKQALLDLGKALHNIDTATIKVGIIKSAANGGFDPTATLADPRWGTGGTTNLSTGQVTTGGTSYTAPLTLASKTWAAVSNNPTLAANTISLAQDASGFTNGRWAIIYNDTDAGKRALAYVDLGADRSLVTGPLSIDWYGVGNEILNLV